MDAHIDKEIIDDINQEGGSRLLRILGRQTGDLTKQAKTIINREKPQSTPSKSTPTVKAPNVILTPTAPLPQPAAVISEQIKKIFAYFKRSDATPDLSDLQNITTLSDLKQFELCAQIRKYKEELRKKKPNSPEKDYTIDINSFKPNIYPNPDNLGKYLGTRVISEFLTTLKLVGNSTPPNIFRLQDFPYQICYMYNLRSLTFTGHDVLSIPDSIENLRSLEVLDLKNNKLISFPSGVAFLSKLYYLDLSDNFINEIPGDIYQILSARAPKFYKGKDITYHTIENTSETDFTLPNISGDITEQTNLKNIESKITNTTKVIVKLNLTDGQPPIDHTFLRLILDNSVGDDQGDIGDGGDKIPQDYIVRLLHRYKEAKNGYIENITFRSITTVNRDQLLNSFYIPLKQETDFRKNYKLLNSLIADREESYEIDYGINEDIPRIDYVDSDYNMEINDITKFINPKSKLSQYQIEYLSDFLKYCEIYDGEETDLNKIYIKYNEYQSNGNKFNFNQQKEETYNEVIRIYIMVAEKIKMIQSLRGIDSKIYGIDNDAKVDIKTIYRNVFTRWSRPYQSKINNLYLNWVNIFRINAKITGSTSLFGYDFSKLKSKPEKINRDDVIYLLEQLDDKISELREKKITSLINDKITPYYKTYMGEDMPDTFLNDLRKEYIVDKILGHIIRNSDLISITKYNTLELYLNAETEDFLYYEDDGDGFNNSVMDELKKKLFIITGDNYKSKFDKLISKDFNNLLDIKGDILKINVYYDDAGKICEQESNVTSKKLGDVLRFYKDLENKKKQYPVTKLVDDFDNKKLKQFLGIEKDETSIPEIITKLQRNSKTRNQNELSEIYKDLIISGASEAECLKNTLRIGMNMNIVEKQMGSTSDTEFINSFKRNRLFMAKNPGFDLLNVDIKIGINLYNTNNFINIINTQIVITYLYSLIRYNLKKGLNLITIGKYKFLFNKISGSSSGGGIKFLKGGSPLHNRMPTAFGGEVHRFNPLMNFDEIATEAQIVGDGIREKAKKIKKLVSESFEGRLSEETVQGNPEIKASSTKTVYGKPQDAIRRKNAIRGKGKGRKTQDIQKKISIQSIIEEINKIDTKITYNYNKGNKTLSIIYEGNDYGTVAIKEIFFKDNLYLFRIESIDEDRMMCVPVLIKKLLQKKKPKFTELPSNTYIEIVYHRIEDPTFGLSYPRFLKDEKYGTKTEEEAKDGIGRIEGIIMGVYKILNTNQDTTPYQEKKENVDITDESAYSGYGRVKKPVADASPAVVGDEIYCTYFSEGEVLSKRTMKPKSAQASPSAPQGQNAQESSFIEGIYSGYSSLADNLYSKMSHTKNEEDVYSVYCAYKFEEIPRLLALIERKKDNQAIKDQIPGALNNINNLINELVTPFVPKPPPVMPPDTQGKSIEFLKAKMHTYMGLFIDHPVVGRKIEEQLKTLSTELTEIGQFENVRSVRRSFYEYSVAVSPCSSLEIDIDETYDKTYDQITENSVIEALSSPYYTTDEDGDAAAAANKPYYQTDADLMTNTAPIYSIIEPEPGQAGQPGNLGIYCAIDAEIVTIPPKSN